jgi:phage shock protein PspC (stress-responsive transcriptional regulator)/anti-sigma regulatory factor (Ser/Thr protein kinase)
MSRVGAPTDAAPEPLRRDPDGALIAGVCTGVARRLGVDPIIIRVALVALTFAGGTGAALYALAWALLPAKDGRVAPGDRLAGRAQTWQVVGGATLLALSGMLLLRHWGVWPGDPLVWPLFLAASGGALLWYQSAAPAPPVDPAGAPAGQTGVRLPRGAAGRAAGGAALVAAAALVFLWLTGALRPARDVLLSVIVVLVAAGVILAPWWLRLVRGLTAERAERIRSQERAEVAAHLHDSVLQTLALMQKRADNPREVASLARRQERELRAWLNGTEGVPADSVARALEAVAAAVEEAHGVVVEVVAVGDAPLEPSTEALVAAAREALVNAAKFAPDGAISVYAEVEDGRVQAFVRDRGPGFDPAAVPADRRGLRESVLGRMERHGGHAIVHSAPGAGTEIELVVER